MPLYEYECKQCHHRLEKIQSFNAPPEKVCPRCGGELERVISAPALQFKGAGWYVNDYAKAGGKAAGATGTEAGAGNASGGKPETKDAGSKSSGEAAAAGSSSSSDSSSASTTSTASASKSSPAGS